MLRFKKNDSNIFSFINGSQDPNWIEILNKICTITYRGHSNSNVNQTWKATLVVSIDMGSNSE